MMPKFKKIPRHVQKLLTLLIALVIGFLIWSQFEAPESNSVGGDMGAVSLNQKERDSR